MLHSEVIFKSLTGPDDTLSRRSPGVNGLRYWKNFECCIFQNSSFHFIFCKYSGMRSYFQKYSRVGQHLSRRSLGVNGLRIRY